MRRLVALLGMMVMGAMVISTWNKLEPTTWALIATGFTVLVAAEVYLFIHTRKSFSLPHQSHDHTQAYGEMILEMTSLVIQLHDFLQEHDWREDVMVRERALTTAQVFDDHLKLARQRLASGTIGQTKLFTELLYLFSLYLQRVHLAFATQDPLILHENSLPEERIIYLTGLVGEYLHSPPAGEISM